MDSVTSSDSQGSTQPVRRRVTAQLVSDSRSVVRSLTPAGLRAVTGDLNSYYQMLYLVDDGRVEVDLQIRPSRNRAHFNLIGQVVGTQALERKVELQSRRGGPMMEAPVDEAFTFQYADIPGDEYRLEIYCDEEIVEIALLSL